MRPATAARRGEEEPARRRAVMVPYLGPARGDNGPFLGQTPLRSSTRPRVPKAGTRPAQGGVVAALAAGRTPR
eukprot:4091009-Alexandrium_andersonii.AAC.1